MYLGRAIVVSMSEVTTRDAAQILGVDQSRIRALINAGTLPARRIGDRWLLDRTDIERHRALIDSGANTRAMSTRIAWAAAAILDAHPTDWITATERSRLKRRLTTTHNTHAFQRWLSTRATTRQFRVSENDLAELITQQDVIATGISAAATYQINLSNTGQGDAYVTTNTLHRLIDDYLLIESDHGNLTLREVDGHWHEHTARHTTTATAAARLMVGVDLADASDHRSQTAGHRLIATTLHTPTHPDE